MDTAIKTEKKKKKLTKVASRKKNVQEALIHTLTISNSNWMRF